MHKLALSILSILLFSLFSCAQNEVKAIPEEPIIKISQEKAPKQNVQHPYGGWYCPDNLRGFPAVNVSEWNKVPVVNGRMSTEEETRNGTSLMFIDPIKYPDAKPMDIVMPQLARYYNEYTQKKELIIIIQAVTVANDSVVGFRYINGGNGSARFNKVEFLSKEEVKTLPSSPFVSEKLIIAAPAKNIFNVITNPIYAKQLGNVFKQGAYFESEWKKNAKVYFKDALSTITRTGQITALWKNTYIQIDYNFEGQNYVEKIFLMYNTKTENTELQLVSGPFSKDFIIQQALWISWLQKVKELSEAE